MDRHKSTDDTDQYEGSALILKGKVDDIRESQTVQQDENRKDRRSERRFNLLLVVFTGATALVGMVQGYFTWRALTVADRQAAAAERSNSLAKQAMEKSDRQSQEAAAITAQANKVSRELSQASLTASIEAFRNDQRAWVGAIERLLPAFTEDTTPVFIKAGSKAPLGVVITNTGKTPARHVITYSAVIAYPKESVFIPNYGPRSGRKLSLSVIQPNMRLNLVVNEPENGVFTQSDVDSIKSGRSVLYLYGLIRYEDIFGRAHRSTYCLMLMPSLTELGSCPIYNDSN